jgi:hypothetical protein
VGESRIFIFRWDADEATDEVVDDPEGGLSMPKKGDILTRNGHPPSKVAMVVKYESNNPKLPIPTYTVVLSTKT